MRFHFDHRFEFRPIVSSLVTCLVLLSACASRSLDESDVRYRPKADGLSPLADSALVEPVELKLKSEVGRVEKVAYLYRSTSSSFEGLELRSRKEESLEFTSQSETVKVEPTSTVGVERINQIISVVHKDGIANLRDFAMPEPGERLEIAIDSRGRILKSGDWPENSIFYVSPISLPQRPVSVGDTWTMQASWLSLDEMIPYQLDMVSILKSFWRCGTDTCAEIEISGQVSLQGSLNQLMGFKSQWRGRIFFSLGAGSVLWSRVDSEESLVTEKVRREDSGCLEASLLEPASIKLSGIIKPSCEPMP